MSPRPRQHGTPVNSPDIPAGMREVLTTLGDSNMDARGLTFGSGADGEDAGRHDACFARVAVPGSPTTVDVPHKLGRVPVTASVWEIVAGPTGDSAVLVSSVSKETWTATVLRVRIAPSAGTPTGAVVVLLVS